MRKGVHREMGGMWESSRREVRRGFIDLNKHFQDSSSSHSKERSGRISPTFLALHVAERTLP